MKEITKLYVNNKQKLNENSVEQRRTIIIKILKNLPNLSIVDPKHIVKMKS